MSFVQYTRSPKTGPGTFLAVPAYEKISAPFVQSLFATQANLNHRLDLEIFSGNCHVDDTRNRLVRDFLETDCDQLIFLDVDVSWLEADFKKLVEFDRDIVAGIYPLKSGDEDYPVLPLPGERWADNYGLVEVAGVPTGFLKIKRRVFETLYPTVRQHRSKEDKFGRKPIPIIFERTLNGMSRRGGDIEFCRKAREAGFKVYVDPSMQLGHVGQKHWSGCLGHYWRKDVAIPEGLNAIRAGTANAATYLEMYNVWDNHWALSPEGLFTCALLAGQAKGPIFECGSGLSTLCMAAATDHIVHAVEHSAVWASRIESIARQNGLTNIRVHLTDIKDYGAFQWFAEVPKEPYALVLCDGPPRKIGRAGLFTVLRDEIKGAQIVVDDIAEIEWRQTVETYCRDTGRKLEFLDDTSKPFALIR